MLSSGWGDPLICHQRLGLSGLRGRCQGSVAATASLAAGPNSPASSCRLSPEQLMQLCTSGAPGPVLEMRFWQQLSRGHGCDFIPPQPRHHCCLQRLSSTPAPQPEPLSLPGDPSSRPPAASSSPVPNSRLCRGGFSPG